MTEPLSNSSVAPLSAAPGRISGMCLTREGEPVPGVRLRIFGPDGIMTDTQLSDRRGRYATRLLYAGDYRVEARLPHRGLVAVREVRVELGKVTKLDFTVGDDLSDVPRPS